MISKSSFILVLLSLTGSAAFTPIALTSTTVGSTATSTQLQFGIPTFGAGKKDDEQEKKNADEPEKKIGFSGLAQLITAGMGSPFLGDFEGVDKETGNFMFSLEANNLVDEDGKSKQTSMPYFESGWVDEKDLEKERLKKEKGGGFKFW